MHRLLNGVKSVCEGNGAFVRITVGRCECFQINVEMYLGCVMSLRFNDFMNEALLKVS